jgi:hypothetical protein
LRVVFDSIAVGGGSIAAAAHSIAAPAPGESPASFAGSGFQMLPYLMPSFAHNSLEMGACHNLKQISDVALGHAKGARYLCECIMNMLKLFRIDNN